MLALFYTKSGREHKRFGFPPVCVIFQFADILPRLFRQKNHMGGIRNGKSFTELAAQQMASIGLPENQMNAARAAVPEMGYTLDGKNITVLVKTGSETLEHSGEFKLENNTLTLPGFGADTLTLTRAE